MVVNTLLDFIYLLKVKIETLEKDVNFERILYFFLLFLLFNVNNKNAATTAITTLMFSGGIEWYQW